MPVHISTDYPRIQAVFDKHHIGVLATANTDAVPHAASIYFYADEDFNVYFVTRSQTAKQQNLESNPRASLVVYEAAAQMTVQLDGTVSKIDNENQCQEISRRIFAITRNTSYKEMPPFAKLNAGEYVAYRLSPTNLRFAQYVQTDQEKEAGKPIFDTVDFTQNDAEKTSD